MGKINLIHPIYLDVPMLVSFAAAIQGGLSFGSEVTQETGATSSREGKMSANIGVSKLFSSLFDASAKAESVSGQSDEDRQTIRESRSHTEASIAISLYDHLQREEGYIFTPQTAAEFQAAEPGTLIQLAGVVMKNAIDAVIDYIDAIDILSSLATLQPANQSKKKTTKSPLRNMRDGLDADRKRTPISNVLFNCSEPSEVKAVLTLRTANLRDLTLSELHKNTVRVIGKVTRTIGVGERMSAFENYGMALMRPDLLRETFNEIISNEDIVAEFSDVEVQGPAVQVLPLMIFV